MFIAVQYVDIWIQEQKQENKISLLNLNVNFQIAWYFVECKQNPIVYMHFFFIWLREWGLATSIKKIPHWGNMTHLASMGWEKH